MKDPKITTKVVHSLSKPAWNVVGTKCGSKRKIARVPYVDSVHPEAREICSNEAREHAEFISWCFNNSAKILAMR